MSRSTKMETASFEKVTDNIEAKVNNIKSIFKEMNSAMSNIDGSNKIWQGRAQELVYKKYTDVSKKYSTINEQLDAYVNFLRETLENYKKEEKVLEASASDNETDLIV